MTFKLINTFSTDVKLILTFENLENMEHAMFKEGGARESGDEDFNKNLKFQNFPHLSKLMNFFLPNCN